jgi:hypothetical protein
MGAQLVFNDEVRQTYHLSRTPDFLFSILPLTTFDASEPEALFDLFIVGGAMIVEFNFVGN